MSHIDLNAIELDAIPGAEGDEWEFKSSAISPNDLKKKLYCAVSGFANSGGGYFIAGVDGNGDPDGGIPATIGKQDLRDWADQIIHQVQPAPVYDIKLFDDPKGRGNINADHLVMMVGIDESIFAPHMAPDNRYYIRAGAHTVAARHFITDAIWAKRHVNKPRLIHNWRFKPGDDGVIQLGVVALTNAPAIDVSVNLKPLGDFLKGSKDRFPLQLPLIDTDNPHYFDVTTWFKSDERFGENVQMDVVYHDLAGNKYDYSVNLNTFSGLSPVQIGKDATAKMAKSLESIEKLLQKLAN